MDVLQENNEVRIGERVGLKRHPTDHKSPYQSGHSSHLSPVTKDRGLLLLYSQSKKRCAGLTHQSANMDLCKTMLIHDTKIVPVHLPEIREMTSMLL